MTAAAASRWRRLLLTAARADALRRSLNFSLASATASALRMEGKRDEMEGRAAAAVEEVEGGGAVRGWGGATLVASEEAIEWERPKSVASEEDLRVPETAKSA